MNLKEKLFVRLFYSLALCVVFSGCTLFKSNIQKSDEWKTVNLDNGLIRVTVAPQAGGRVIQYKLGDHNFFWVNKDLEGMVPPSSGLTADGKWLNYGGEKLWPAPQGWDNEDQWPGPPDPVLDGSPHQSHVVIDDDGKPIGVNLTSRSDTNGTGIRFSRSIKIFDGTTRVSVDAFMKNISNRSRRWGIWSVAQLDARTKNGDGPNRGFTVYCPMNSESCFPGGYKVLYGNKKNQSFKPDRKNNLLTVHYMRKVGKVGIDSPAGWIAAVNGEENWVFAERFTYYPGEKYPDDSSVEFWCEGTGSIKAYGKTVEMPENPFCLLESEILGPLKRLEPGESTTFHYEWYAARIGGDYPVLSCNNCGVTCEKLSAHKIGGKIALRGRFGVFYEGTIKVFLFDGMGRKVGEAGEFAVSPLKPLIFDNVSLEAGKVPLKEAVDILLVLEDRLGEEVGELAAAELGSD